MPVLILNTNVPTAKVKEDKDFLKKMSAKVAKLLGKPESYVCVHVNGDQLMTFGGTEEPCGLVTLDSLGSVGPGKNQKLVEDITLEIENSLGIRRDRLYVKICDIARTDMGWNGKTFG